MDEVEEIKRRIDIVDLISSYLTLKKAGSNYKAICPFHQEKTPSFMVSAEKQIFKCFGCGEGGDIFTFTEKMENLEFPEALRLLADRAGVELKRRSFKPEEGKDRKTKLYQINDLSARVFHKILISHPAGKIALEYLKKRGISSETMKEFMIGYAPAFAKATAGKPSYLTKFLMQRGFTEEEIKNAGSPDRFFKRIIFPIRNRLGQTIAFTGRVLDPKQEPKYLNTPDTIIFHKGTVLYNLDQARGAIKQQNAVIVVEGQMDVIASHQTGVQNVVASSGTALTADHLQILYRYTPNINFAFDSDSAGLITAKKAYEMAITLGFNVKMVLLEDYKDPGEMIAANPPAGGPKLWQEAVTKAVPVIDWYFEIAFQKTENRKEKIELTSQEKKEIAKEILPIIKIIPDSIEQAHYINLLAKRLGVNEDIVFDALSKVNQQKRDKPREAVKREQLSTEQLLIAILLYRPAKITPIKEKIKEDDLKDPVLKKIYSTLLEEYNINGKIAKSLFDADRELKNLAASLIFAAENLYFDEQDKIDEDLKELIKHIASAKKEALKAHYADEIKKAEKSHNIAKLKKLIEEFQDAIS